MANMRAETAETAVWFLRHTKIKPTKLDKLSCRPWTTAVGIITEVCKIDKHCP